MPHRAQKQVMVRDKPTAIQPAIWRLSSCFISGLPLRSAVPPSRSALLRFVTMFHCDDEFSQVGFFFKIPQSFRDLA
jgi:hypothetical protein